MPKICRLVVLFTAVMCVHAAQQVVRPKPGAPGQWRLIGQTHADHGAEFWYDTRGFLSGKADVTVFGQK